MKRHFQETPERRQMSGRGGRAGFSNVPRKRGRPRKEKRKRGRPRNTERDHASWSVDEQDKLDEHKHTNAMDDFKGKAKADEAGQIGQSVEPVPVIDKRLGTIQVIESHYARTKEQWEVDMQNKFTDIFSKNDDHVALAVWGHVAAFMWAEIGRVPVNDAADMMTTCKQKIREAIALHDPNFNVPKKVPDIEVHFVFTRVYNEVRKQFRSEMAIKSPDAMTPCSPPRSPHMRAACSPQNPYQSHSMPTSPQNPPRFSPA